MAIVHEGVLNARKYQSLEEIIAELKLTLPWLWEPAFKVGPIQGYFGDGQLFGACAGFAHHLSSYNVVHEVGHAVELTLLEPRTWKRRITQDGFGIRIKTYQDIMGSRYFEPVTMQPTERECRVGGIQKRILEAGGYDTSDFVRHYVRTLRYMSDSCFGGSCPLNTPNPEDYTPEQRAWVDLRTRLVEQAYEQHSLEDVQHRWKTVMNWLGSRT